MVISAKTLGTIKKYEIKYIINIILDYALAKPQKKSLASLNLYNKVKTT